METSKTLYKKDTSGKIRFLIVETFIGTLVQTSGVVGTSSPVTAEKFCPGKNTGKANETSADEQAKKQAEAVIKDKISKGYFFTPEEANTENVVLPMLAKDYKKEAHKINWDKDDVFVQPKFDGMRCLAFIKKGGQVTLMSRTGKKIDNMEHIERELAFLNKDVILDGELYIHGENFQNNMRYIKKYQKGLTEKVCYHVYDTVSDFSFSGRHEEVKEMVGPDKRFSYIKTVETEQVYSESEIKAYQVSFTSKLYEGTMVRIAKSSYDVNKRSSELLKYKDFIDLALPILDITPNEYSITQGTPHFELDGKRFKAGMKYSHADREEMLANKQNYIGKVAEIRFFEYMEAGTPRFPVMVGIRLDK